MLFIIIDNKMTLYKTRREILSDRISLAGSPSRNYVLQGCVEGLNGEGYF